MTRIEEQILKNQLAIMEFLKFQFAQSWCEREIKHTEELLKYNVTKIQ